MILRHLQAQSEWLDLSSSWKVPSRRPKSQSSHSRDQWWRGFNNQSFKIQWPRRLRSEESPLRIQGLSLSTTLGLSCRIQKLAFLEEMSRHWLQILLQQSKHEQRTLFFRQLLPEWFFQHRHRLEMKFSRPQAHLSARSQPGRSLLSNWQLGS